MSSSTNAKRMILDGKLRLCSDICAAYVTVLNLVFYLQLRSSLLRRYIQSWTCFCARLTCLSGAIGHQIQAAVFYAIRVSI